jgi:hypothetical protein
MHSFAVPRAGAPVGAEEVKTMRHRRDDHGQAPHHGGHRARGSGEEPVFTTMAVGEEGDPDFHPDPVVHRPEEPVYTTMAVGEEGEPDPRPDPIGSPEEFVFTTLAVGEEGGDPEAEWPVATTMAVGEEGCPGPEEGGFATTAAIGEEGDPGLDPWGA